MDVERFNVPTIGNVPVVYPEAAPVDEFKGPEFRRTKLRQAKTKVLSLRHINQSAIKCTACGHQISILDKTTVAVHPVLKVLVCEKCSVYYYSGDFLQDENGIDEHCRWCGEGGNVLLCDDCSNVFCRNCVRRNFGREFLSEVRNEDNWLCFVCNPAQLKDLVSLARDVLNACDEIDKSSQKEIESSQPRQIESSQPEPSDARKCVSPLKLRKDDDDEYFVNSANRTDDVNDDYEIISNNSPKPLQNISTPYVNGFESGNDSTKSNDSSRKQPIKVRIRNNRIDDDEEITNKEKSASENEQFNDRENEKENNVPDNYSSSASNTTSTKPRPFQSRGKDFRKLLKEREKEVREQEISDLSGSAESERNEPVTLPNEEENSLLLSSSDSNKNEDDDLTQLPEQSVPAEQETEETKPEQEDDEDMQVQIESQSPEPPFSLSSWTSEFEKKFEEGSKLVKELCNMVDKLKSYDDAFATSAGQTATANTVKRSPFKFKQFKTTAKALKKISKISKKLIESRDILSKKKSKLLENNTGTISESSTDESDDEHSLAKVLFKKVSSPSNIDKLFAEEMSTNLLNDARSEVENNSESILSNIQPQEQEKPPSGEDELSVSGEDEMDVSKSLEEEEEAEKCNEEIPESPQEKTTKQSPDLAKPTEEPEEEYVPDSPADVTPLSIDELPPRLSSEQDEPEEEEDEAIPSTSKQSDDIKEIKVRLKLLSDKNIEDLKEKLLQEEVEKAKPITSDMSEFSEFSDSDDDMFIRRRSKRPNGEKSKKKKKKTEKSKFKISDDEDFIKSDASDSPSSDEYASESDYFNESDDEIIAPSGLRESLSSENTLKQMLLQRLVSDDDMSSDSDVENLLNRDNTQKIKTRHKSGSKDEKSDSKKTDDESKSNKQKRASHPLLKKFALSSDEEDSEPPVTRSQLRRKRRRTSEDSEKTNETIKKKTKRRIISDSDSDLTEDSSAGEDGKKKKETSKPERKTSNESSEKSIKLESSLKSFLKGSEDDINEFMPFGSQKKKRRKRVKVKESDEDSSDAPLPSTQGSVNSTPGSKIGRKNIRKIQESSQSMVEATTEEWKRRERIAQQQKKLLSNKQEVVVIEDEEVEKKTVTRFFLSKNPDVEVDVKIVKYLKKHQEEGIRFLWNNVVENVEKANDKNSKGAGCILAHCMGLGKTLQSITFLNTVLLSQHLPNMRTALVICPKGTVTNWENEFDMWLRKGKSFQELRNKLRVFVLDKRSRSTKLQEWHRRGGVMVMGYGLFRSLITPKRKGHPVAPEFIKTLSDPGPDILLCDEGHLLKNAKSNIQSVVSDIKTRRKIILTGTPLQNNLSEYHCMISLVKPRLLGTIAEFRNQFINPIDNGQMIDSTPRDVKLMKKRAHILNQLMKGCVQRKDFTSLTKDLKPKFEYVISVRLTAQQIHMYRTFLGNFRNLNLQKKCLFKNFNTFLLICSHPYCLKLSSIRKKKREDLVNNDSDCDGFVISSDEEEVDDDSDENGDDEEIMNTELKEEPKTKEDIKKLSKRALKLFIKQKSGKPTELKSHSALIAKASFFLNTPENVDWSKKSIAELKEAILLKGGSTIGCTERSELVSLAKKLNSSSNGVEEEDWFEPLLPKQDNLAQAVTAGNKMVLLLSILEQACELKDKVVVFSQSLLTLTMIELILANVSSGVEQGLSGKDNRKQSRWQKNLDYFRLDGSTSPDMREKFIKKFNDESETRARLFLLSTKAGGIGINLIGANRAIIFDACWNPAHDIQSLFRIYRFGQKKACYIYRLVAQGTMEEKIYERQVVKQSLSYRVIDEQQVDRHFSSKDIAELYEFHPTPVPEKSKSKDETPRLAPPKDDLLAGLFKNKNVEDTVVKYHEHDTLLDNQWEEDLTAEERKAAWEEYDRETTEKQRTNVGPDPNSIYAKLTLDVLRSLETKFMLGIQTIEKTILTIKVPEYTSIYTHLKLKHRAMSTEEGNKLALQEIHSKTLKLQRTTELRRQMNQQLVELRKWKTVRLNEFNVKTNRTFVNPQARTNNRTHSNNGQPIPANVNLNNTRNFAPFVPGTAASTTARPNANNVRVRYTPPSAPNRPTTTQPQRNDRYGRYPQYNNPSRGANNQRFPQPRPSDPNSFRFNPYTGKHI